MYTATIYQDSPALMLCRQLLTKQHLQWDEDFQIMLPGETKYDWECGIAAEYTELRDAIKIVVADCKAKIKATRSAIKRKPKPCGYDCTIQADGSWLWTNNHTGKQHISSFKYDAKHQAKIESETKARINRMLREPLTNRIELKGALFV